MTLGKVDASRYGTHDSHPFSGKDADMKFVERPDGSGFAVKMQHTNGDMNKYSALIDRQMEING